MLTRLAIVVVAALVQVVITLVATDRAAVDWWSVVRGTIAVAIGVAIVTLGEYWWNRRAERR